MSDFQTARRRLDRSQLFQRSGASLLLLDFLLDVSAEGPVKETSVGVLFFKRDATYDPRHDAIARTSVRRLRERLKSFYVTEGADEAFQIVIPAGSFTPVLAPSGTVLVNADELYGRIPGDALLVDAAESDSSSIRDVPFQDVLPEGKASPDPQRRTRALAMGWSIAVLSVLLAAAGLLSWNLHARPLDWASASQGAWRSVPLASGHTFEFEPAVSRDGKRLAFVSQLPGTLRSQIYLRYLASDPTTGITLATGEGDALYPAWSPDAKEIAFLRCGAGPCEIAVVPVSAAKGALTAEGSVKVVRPLPLYILPDNQPYYQFRQVGPIWSRDGRSLIYPYRAPGDNAERLVQQDLLTGALRQLTFGDPGDDDGAPAISHDGQHLAFLRRNADHTDLVVLKLQSGASRVLDREPNHTPSGVTWTPDDSAVIVGIRRKSAAAVLMSFPMQGKSRELDVRLPNLLNPAFTGDGDALMTLSFNRNRNLALMQGDDTGAKLPFGFKAMNSFSAISPDTHHLAFLSSLLGSYELWISDREGTTFSAPRQLTHGLPYYPDSVSWAPDGRTLAVGISHTSTVEMVDARTGDYQALRLPGLERSTVWSPTWSSDGRSIYLAVQGERRGIVRASATLIPGIEPLMSGDAQELRLDAGPDGDRALYFVTGDSHGVYKLQMVPGSTLDSVKPEPVRALAAVDPANEWLISGGQMYYLDLHDPSRRLHSYDLQTGREAVRSAPLERPAFLWSSLTYLPAERLLLYSKWTEDAGSQVFLLYPEKTSAR